MDWNHRWLLRGVLFYLSLCALVLLLSGCQTTASVSNQAPFCLTYSPVYWSSRDTRKTIEQADANNRVWKQLCMSKK